MSGDIETLLNLFGARLPEPYAFSIEATAPLPADHPLVEEVNAAIEGRAASLPYVRANDVLWVTIGPEAEALRRLIADLRCWILPSYGWEAAPAIVSDAGGPGQTGAMLLAHSPHGYYRWYSRLEDTDEVIARIATMRAVVAGAPKRQNQIRPTLELLRRQFTLGLATGDHDAAFNAIEEIDRRQLDTAPNALSMRIRLAAAFGDDQSIVGHPQLDDLLAMRLPRRVVESVLIAHHSVGPARYEAAGDIEGALAAYLPYADRLAGLAEMPAVGAQESLIRMAAYDAAFVQSDQTLLRLAQVSPYDPVIAALLAYAQENVPTAGSTQQPVTPPATETVETMSPLASLPADPDEFGRIEEVETPSIADADPPLGFGADPREGLPATWEEIPALVAGKAHARLSGFLDNVVVAPEAYDPGDGDFLFEVFTDTSITEESAKLRDADRVLTTVIDAYVCEERFPRRDRLPFYQSVMDIWSSSRALSSDPIDGQLLITMADALLRLDGKRETIVATAIIRWWEARPVRSRLSWLGEALELLTEQSVSQDHLALWYDGAGLIKTDADGLSLADRHLWRRLGRRLGLDEIATDNALGGPWPATETSDDALLLSGFKKIAIVSLHERAAREAALQIEQRTEAQVVVVTDHAAGEGTSSASTADVILFVWGATKHAVYRAFDKVRDRLEYVQGTGSASIVRALERRALHSQP
jgi:hypothetical protein